VEDGNLSGYQPNFSYNAEGYIFFSSSFCSWQQVQLLDFHPVSKREKPRPPVALARQNMWKHRLYFNSSLLL